MQHKLILVKKDLFFLFQNLLIKLLACFKQVMNTNPTLPMQSYDGTYTSPIYGEELIEAIDGKLNLTMNNLLHL